MKVKIKRLHPNSIIPKYGREGDAGLDLTSVDFEVTDEYIEHRIGLSIEIPEGYVGLIFPRSSITSKRLLLKNSVGVIDSNFRGELRVRFHDLDPKFFVDYYKPGDRVAQLIILPIPYIDLVEVDSLSETIRQEGGFGSSGR